MDEPMLVLRQAIKAVPAVKYALGVAGVAAVVAIVKLYGLDFEVAAFGTIVVLFLMVALVLFAKLTALRPADFRLPSLVFTWACLVLLIGTVSLLFTSAFFAWPKNFERPVAATAADMPQPAVLSSKSAPAELVREPAIPVPQPRAELPSPLKLAFDTIKGEVFKGEAGGPVDLHRRHCANGVLEGRAIEVQFTSLVRNPDPELDTIDGTWKSTETCDATVFLTEQRKLYILLRNTGMTGTADLASCSALNQSACDELPQSMQLALRVENAGRINLGGTTFAR